jgi:hypothetical protein
MKFILTKDDSLLGTFSIWKDDKIKFKISEYSKDIFNLNMNFVDNIKNDEITMYIEQFIKSLIYFKLKIKSVYLFRNYYEKYINNLFENGFKEIEQGLYHSKLEKFIEKESNIIIKNI